MMSSFTQSRVAFDGRLLISALIPFLCLWMTGCGNKTFPRPMSELARPEIGDLSVTILPRGVELSWSIPEAVEINEKGASHKFLIVKAPVKWTGRNCPECPVDNQTEVQQIDPSAPQPARKEGNKLFWVDPSVARNQAYRYQIIIQDKKERPEAQSNPVIAKVVPGPGRLRNLEATTQPQGIMLHWKKSSKDDQGNPLQGEIQYLIERRSGTGAWEKISSVPIRSNSFLDKAVASNQSYDYRVTPSINFEGALVMGEPVISSRTRAPGAVPPPPPKTVWTIPTQGSIEVHWMESEGNAGGYHVYRKEGKEITRLTATPVSKGPYVDRGVRKNVVYSYAVSAVNAQAEEQEGLLSKWVEIRSLQFE